MASTSTAIPAGKGSFTTFSLPNGFPTNPSIIAFFGGGASQQGIYSLLYGGLVKVADLNTPIPGGTGDYVSWPAGPAGANVAFVGNGAKGHLRVPEWTRRTPGRHHDRHPRRPERAQLHHVL